MMNSWRSAAIVFLFVPLVWGASGLAGGAGGEKKPAFPTPLGYVSDYADLIEPDWQGRIRAVCKELEDRTGVEMIVVTIETASPHSHAREYAEGLYKEWHIGAAQQERGMLLLASLKERQAVVVLGRSLLSLVGKPKLDELSAQYLIPMFQNARYGESLYRTACRIGLGLGQCGPSGRRTETLVECGILDERRRGASHVVCPLAIHPPGTATSVSTLAARWILEHRPGRIWGELRRVRREHERAGVKVTKGRDRHAFIADPLPLQQASRLQRLVVFKRDGPRHRGAFLIGNNAPGRRQIRVSHPGVRIRKTLHVGQ